jgi:hypothetical protein
MPPSALHLHESSKWVTSNRVLQLASSTDEMSMQCVRSSHHVGAKVMSGFVLAACVGSGWPAAAAETTPQKRDWELVRSVKNPYGGTNDLVLIPERKKRDEADYLEVANAVCKERVQCMVNFWTDRAHIPKSANMPTTAAADEPCASKE